LRLQTGASYQTGTAPSKRIAKIRAEKRCSKRFSCAAPRPSAASRIFSK